MRRLTLALLASLLVPFLPSCAHDEPEAVATKDSGDPVVVAKDEGAKVIVDFAMRASDFKNIPDAIAHDKYHGVVSCFYEARIDKSSLMPLRTMWNTWQKTGDADHSADLAAWNELKAKFYASATRINAIPAPSGYMLHELQSYKTVAAKESYFANVLLKQELTASTDEAQLDEQKYTSAIAFIKAESQRSAFPGVCPDKMPTSYKPSRAWERHQDMSLADAVGRSLLHLGMLDLPALNMTCNLHRLGPASLQSWTLRSRMATGTKLDGNAELARIIEVPKPKETAKAKKKKRKTAADDAAEAAAAKPPEAPKPAWAPVYCTRDPLKMEVVDSRSGRLVHPDALCLFGDRARSVEDWSEHKSDVFLMVTRDAPTPNPTYTARLMAYTSGLTPFNLAHFVVYDDLSGALRELNADTQTLAQGTCTAFAVSAK